ncbi:MAG: hypothetical protein K0Q66_1105 [Chitinophagaceae bacterium]|jgi:hypothetical protein|nr:hypothetical protein [Chitinophagaceae bacterium]
MKMSLFFLSLIIFPGFFYSSYAQQLPDDVKKKLERKYDYVSDAAQGLVIVEKKDKMGLADFSGKELVKPQYDWLEFIFDDDRRLRFVLTRMKVDNLNNTEGLLNVYGKELVPLYKYNDIGKFDFKEGCAQVGPPRGDGGWTKGIIDTSGKELLPVSYSHYTSCSGGLIITVSKEKYGLMDKSGNTILPFVYDRIEDFQEGVAFASLNDKWGLIDKTGKLLIPTKYDRVLEKISEGLIGAFENGKWGYLDFSGKTIIPFAYSHAYIFSEGLGCVKQNGKYGFIDRAGKTILPFVYDNAGVFVNGRAWVKLNDKWMYIDKEGKEVK